MVGDESDGKVTEKEKRIGYEGKGSLDFSSPLAFWPPAPLTISLLAMQAGPSQCWMNSTSLPGLFPFRSPGNEVGINCCTALA